jgi:hypothetical protein
MKRTFFSLKKHNSTIFLLLLFSLISLIFFQSVLAATLNLTASWTANTDPDMSTYRLYRTDGTRTLIGTTPHPNTTYPFTVNVPDGSYGTLVFVLTAVDINNNESLDSNPGSYSYDLKPKPTTTCTITTNPPGLQVVVDGITYTTPQTFTWDVGSSHTLSVPSPQYGTSGTQYVFDSWSDRKAQTHSITTPSSSTTYTANLTTQYMLNTSVNLPEGGSVSPIGSLWYNSGKKVSLRAKANKNYVFTGWSGNASGTESRYSLIMNGPKNITGNFKVKPFIQVLAPNGGEGYLVGEPMTISWNSGSLDPNGTLYLFYYYDGAWHPITTTPTTETSFDWTIPRIPEPLGSEIPKARARSTKVWIGNWVNGGWECWDWSDLDSFILHDVWVFTLSQGDSGGAILLFDENIFSGYGLSLELEMFRIDGNYTVNSKGQISGGYRLLDFYNSNNQLGSGELSGSMSSKGTSTLQLKNADGKLVFKMDGLRSFEDPEIPTNWMAILEGDDQGVFNSLTIEPYQYGGNDYSPIFRVVGTGNLLEGSVNMEGYFFMTMKVTGSRTSSGNLLYGIFDITGAITETGGFSGTLNPVTGKFTFNLTSDNGNKFKLVGNEN